MTSGRPGRLGLARWECDRHAQVLGDALGRWQALVPAPALAAIESDAALRQLTAPISFRFARRTCG